MTRGFLFIAVLGVAVIGCHDPNKYLPVGPDTPDGTRNSPITDMTATPDSIRATGAAHATITAKIDPRSSIKTMKFATTRGTLSGHGVSTSTEKPTIDVPVSDSGVVTVDLQSSAQPGLATITASISTTGTAAQTFTRTVDVTFSAVPPADVITLVATPNVADADGASRITLTATILPEVAVANTEVVFSTTAGDFPSHKDGKVPISGGSATVQLRSPQQPATVQVTALVGTFRAFAQVTFNRAAPDTVFVQPEKSAVALTSDEVLISTFLYRDVGQAASNVVVTYEARDSGGNLIGTFLGPTIAVRDPEEGDDVEFKRLKSTAKFDPVDTAATGPATITVRAAGKTATTIVQIVP